jgi:hypothetical protein
MFMNGGSNNQHSNFRPTNSSVNRLSLDRLELNKENKPPLELPSIRLQTISELKNHDKIGTKPLELPKSPVVREYLMNNWTRKRDEVNPTALNNIW